MTGQSYKVDTYESTYEKKTYKVSQEDEEIDDCNIEEMSNESNSERYD